MSVLNNLKVQLRAWSKTTLVGVVLKNYFIIFVCKHEVQTFYSIFVHVSLILQS